MRKSYFLGFLAAASVASVASANIIPELDAVAPTGSDFQWNYQVDVTLDQRVEPGDFFTIYDFGGFVPGSNMQPAGWTFSSALVGLTPATVLPQDDLTLANLTWTYNGDATIIGPTDLGIFSAASTQSISRFDNFTASATRNGAPADGTDIDNIGLVAVPVPEMSALAPIIGVAGLGMIGIANSLFRRRKNS